MSSRGPLLVILRALGLGDLLTAVPALRALAAAFPDHRRVLLTPSAFGPLVRRERLADEVVDHFGLAPLPAELSHPDIAVDLHGRGPGSQPLLLRLRPRHLIAFAHPSVPETAGSPQWVAADHEVHRWCRLLAESGIPADERLLDITPPPGPQPTDRPGATIVHPGAQFAARRWPVDRWAAVIRRERTAGREVIITGSADERLLAEAVRRAVDLPPADVLAGRTDLDQLGRLVADAGRVVSGDTGVAHLATALRTPSVVLFGPVSPARWGPPPERHQHLALWHGHEGDPHGEIVDPGLLEIRPPEVVAALDRLDELCVAGQGG